MEEDCGFASMYCNSGRRLPMTLALVSPADVWRKGMCVGGFYPGLYLIPQFLVVLRARTSAWTMVKR